MVQKVRLANGTRILTEEIPAVRSVALGIWVKVGSRDEFETEGGIAHLIEHMMFKGTKQRTPKALAEALDAVGGQLNAFTSKEYTCYYAKVLDEHFDLALDVLSDMFFNSLFDPADLEKEKKVVLEEIKMYEDTPDDQVHDLLVSQMLAGHALGRPIIGTKESVNSFSREQVVEFYRRHYVPSNVVIAVAGNINSQQATQAIEKYFADWQGATGVHQTQEVRNHGGIVTKKKEIEQMHLCLGMPALPLDDPKIYVLHVLNSILGGGLSSRLFQTIREEQGMAYSVYSYQSSYRDAGLFGIYAGLSSDNLAGVLELVFKELAQVKHNGITDEELVRAKAQLKGNMFLSLENVSSRMSRIGKSEISLDKITDPDEIVEKITSVTTEEVQKMANQLFQKEQITIATIGPYEDRALIKEMLDKSEL